MNVRLRLITHGLSCDVPQRLGKNCFPLLSECPSPISKKESMQPSYNTPPSDNDVQHICNVPNSPERPSHLCAEWHRSRPSKASSLNQPTILENTMSETSTVTINYLPKSNLELDRQHLIQYYQLEPLPQTANPHVTTHNKVDRKKTLSPETRKGQSKIQETMKTVTRERCKKERLKNKRKQRKRWQ